MPIHIPFPIERLSYDEFGAFDYVVMGHMFASQNTIGRLADERVYQADVAQRLCEAGMTCETEVPIQLIHKSFVKELFLDLIVDRKAVYEFKAVSSLNSKHVAQLLTYLYLLDLPRGKLINFRSSAVESQFVNAPIPNNERREFSVSDESHCGDRNLIKLVVDLVRDWGTSLSVALYHQTLVHLLGGEDAVQRLLPLARGGKHLANQRFYLMNEANAFELTAIPTMDHSYHQQLKRLLDLSPLQTIQWINIAPHRISCQSVKRG